MRRQKREPREISPYQKKLQDPRWQKKRLEILERDGWECRMCGATKTTLHVHHCYYIQGQDPWDSPIDGLVTLCAECHEDETMYRPIEEQNLLFALRKKQVYFLSIRALADAVLHLRIPGADTTPEADGIALHALAWAIKDEDMMLSIFHRFSAFVRESRQN